MDSYRSLIESAFIDHVSDDGLSKVQISLLTGELGLNRNTFYYYYADKFDLAKVIFLQDFAVEIGNDYDASALQYYTRTFRRKTERYPYYARLEVGAHMFDMSLFLRHLMNVCLKRLPFYRNLFAMNETQWLWEFGEMYYPELRRDVTLVLGGRYLDDCAVDYLARLGVNSILTTIQYALKYPEAVKTLSDSRYEPFLNFYWESLSEMIRNHPVAKLRIPK